MATTAFPALFTWKTEFNVGHPEIDAQHRRLVEILNSLHEAMLARKTAQQLSLTLDNLVTYTQRHFTAEERIMRENNYPALGVHKKQHEALASKVLDFQQQLRAGKTTISIEVLQFLKEWLANHILNADREVGKYLQYRTGR